MITNFLSLPVEERVQAIIESVLADPLVSEGFRNTYTYKRGLGDAARRVVLGTLSEAVQAEFHRLFAAQEFDLDPVTCSIDYFNVKLKLAMQADYKRCKHCSSRIRLEKGQWRAFTTIFPQYCWVDEVAGSKLHEPE